MWVMNVCIITLFSPYLSLSSFSFFLCALVFIIDYIKKLSYRFIIINIYFYIFLLAPAFAHIWLVIGSGNASFFYAITLLFIIINGYVVTELLGIIIRVDYCRKHGIPYEGVQDVAE